MAHASARLKADRTVNTALDAKIDREAQWIRKGSITTYSEDHYIQASTDVDDVRNRVQCVKTCVKNAVSDEFSNMWHKHIKSLVVQGRFLELLTIEQTHITWRSCIYSLPREVLQFAVNASIDTLATNANLKRWGKRTNAICGLCNTARETIHHVLNNCSMMLDRYKWHHDSILNFLAQQLNTYENVEICIDLPGKFSGVSTVPTSIIPTTMRPDIVLISKSTKKVCLLELSIPFEANISATHLRKVQRYEALISDIESNGYTVKYYPIEIGSRGFIDPDNIGRLKSFFREVRCNVKIKFIKDSLSRISLIASFIVFHSKFEDTWLEPNFISFWTVFWCWKLSANHILMHALQIIQHLVLNVNVSFVCF